MAGVEKIRARKIHKVVDIGGVSSEDSERIIEKVSVQKMATKKVKNRKIRMSLTRAEEKKMDKEIERDDKMSIVLMVIVLIICFVVGISLGYLLYKIAINGAL